MSSACRAPGSFNQCFIFMGFCLNECLFVVSIFIFVYSLCVSCHAVQLVQVSLHFPVNYCSSLYRLQFYFLAVAIVHTGVNVLAQSAFVYSSSRLALCDVCYYFPAVFISSVSSVYICGLFLRLNKGFGSTFLHT